MFQRAGARALARFAFVAAVAWMWLSPRPARAEEPEAVAPDLGVIRYRDPHVARAIWAGVDVGGSLLPGRLGLFDRTVWLVRTTPSWALALTEWLAIGGRHGLTWYDASTDTTIRLRVHEHQLELSGRPMAANPALKMNDRLALGITTHNVQGLLVGDTDFKPGGIRDFILHLGYGIEHPLGRRWALGWNVQLRHVWVFVNTQRQLRAALRGVVRPKPGHELRLQAVLYAVHRDRDQAGNPLPRAGAYGQFTFGYVWMSRYGVGPFVQGRFTTTFLSGEAPVYEIREEALNNLFADLTVGVRGRWGPPKRMKPRREPEPEPEPESESESETVHRSGPAGAGTSGSESESETVHRSGPAGAGTSGSAPEP
jgi:hypothetical protein